MPLPNLMRLQPLSLRAQSLLSLSSRGLSSLTLGIRKEDKNRWERRTPLAPEHVEKLTKSGVKVLVESSDKRIFPDVAYERSGAKVVTDLSQADVILGVKEVPTSKLLPEKAYMFFSHTHKGQPYNMPMLDDILRKKIRLMDYELLTDDKGVRLVKFGIFAGYAGMIDTLHGLGQRMLALGQSTPFLNVGMSYSYPNLKEAKRAISLVGEEIRLNGNPKRFDPMVFVFTGAGHVSQGAQEMFKQLPHKYLTPKELREMFKSKSWDSRLVYGVQVEDVDYVRRKDGKEFEKDFYYSHPEEHYSVFHEEIAPYANVIINGIYWEAKYPRLLSIDQARAQMKRPDNRLVIVGDISCDVEGSMEFTKKVSTIDKPFFLFDSKSNIHEDIEGDGIVVMSIDNLPTELAYESSVFFGNALTGLVPKMLATKNFSELDPIIQRATIANEGKLTSKFEYINDIRRKNGTFQVKDNRRKKVLMFGAGMVAEPVVDVLMEKKDIEMTIASMYQKDGERLAKGNSLVTPMAFDINDKQGISGLVSNHDLAISLAPAPFHPVIAEACISHRKDMVTASYVSPAMRSMHERAVGAGISILNEVGLDPGIDHLSAMKIIDEVKHRGGKVLSFSSVCGGLPAPEASDNPLGYKFSWSPRGVLTAGLNASKHLRDGRVVETPQGDLFRHAFDIDIQYPGFSLECLPNRDSTIYQELYGLQDAHTVFRGTLRFRGFSELMTGLSTLGFFSQDQDEALKSAPTWRQVSSRALGLTDKASRKELLEALRAKVGAASAERILTGMDRLNLLTDKPVEPRGTMLDTLCGHLERELAFREGERDLVILHHDFIVETKEREREHLTSTLVAYGTPGGYSAMAKTVGLPTALGTRLILDGHLHRKGVLTPMTPDIYDPLLDELERRGIRMVEKARKML